MFLIKEFDLQCNNKAEQDTYFVSNRSAKPNL